MSHNLKEADPVYVHQLTRSTEVAQTSDDQLVTLTRGQIAYLMGAAQRWGYEVGYEEGQRDELALATAAAESTYTGSFASTRKYVERLAYRAECDKRAREPWFGDYWGGPKAVWGD